LDRSYIAGRGRSRGRRFGGYRRQEQRGGSSSRGGGPFRGRGGSYPRSQRSHTKKCYVCGKSGCWSTKHTLEEQREAYNKFKGHATYTLEQDVTPQLYNSFLANFEGLEGIVYKQESDTDEVLRLTMEEHPPNGGIFMTEMGEIDGIETVSILNDQSAYHAFTKTDVFQETPSQETESAAFTLNDRYSSHEFQGIMPDSGAAGTSSAGE
jgi:hypothetical protein